MPFAKKIPKYFHVLKKSGTFFAHENYFVIFLKTVLFSFLLNVCYLCIDEYFSKMYNLSYIVIELWKYQGGGVKMTPSPKTIQIFWGSAHISQKSQLNSISIKHTLFFVYLLFLKCPLLVPDRRLLGLMFFRPPLNVP